MVSLRSTRLLEACRRRPHLPGIIVLARRAYRSALTRNVWPR